MLSLGKSSINLRFSLVKVLSCGVHTSGVCLRNESRKELTASMPVKDQGVEGEKSISIDQLIQQKGKQGENIYPDENTPTTLFHGIPFNEIPIVHIKVSPNNTIINLTNPKGEPQILRSCGMEGFKNTRKGTNIAAQATAISISEKILERGIKAVRVAINGLGPGRMSSIKGLQMGGLNIVSITDTTPVSWKPPRARKARRV